MDEGIRGLYVDALLYRRTLALHNGNPTLLLNRSYWYLESSTCKEDLLWLKYGVFV